MEISEQTTCFSPYLASFEQSLSARNYKPATLENYRYQLQRLCKLLEAEGVAPSALTSDLAVELGRRLPMAPKSQIKVPNLARLFVEHMIEIGVATRPPLTPSQAERRELVRDLETYLLRQRGLSPRSVKHVLGFAARFLAYRFGDGMLDLAALSARDVVAFMEHVIARKTPYRDKTLSSHLRCFFQYLFAQGLTTTNLSLCVPRVNKPWGARLPRYLSPDEVEAVLASVATNPRRDARDYAMLLLMARLGMRAPEVMAIQLDDIDWRAGELLVRGKGQRHDRLPIRGQNKSSPKSYAKGDPPYLDWQTERSKSVRHLMFGIPGVDAGKVDMFPTERRDVLQQSIRNVSSRSFQLCDRAIKIDRIPMDDRTDDEVETRGAERLAFERAVADLASLVEKDSAFQLMGGLALVETGLASPP